ncbi:hypothetical protein ACR6EC_23210 [Bacillus subtilis]|uniref:hypothetical protein n=1 Tax=Bacillus subtilis TaxID=1423 RepID=UPI003EB9483E
MKTFKKFKIKAISILKNEKGEGQIITWAGLTLLAAICLGLLAFIFWNPIQNGANMASQAINNMFSTISGIQ